MECIYIRKHMFTYADVYIPAYVNTSTNSSTTGQESLTLFLRCEKRAVKNLDLSRSSF